MTNHRRTATIIVHKEGELESRSLRLPIWLLRTGLIGGVILAVVILVAGVLYTPIARTAAEVPGLKREVERLRAENQQVQRLAERLEYAEARYGQLRSMLGAEVVPELQRQEAAVASLPAVIARGPNAPPCYEVGASVPSHWPLDQAGVITRGPVGPGGSAEVHQGLDIAVAQGTPIRAAGGGLVRAAGRDPEYGLFVRLEHPDGYTSMYGHASRLLVARGDSVRAGQVIGLSGSTGRSTAPHLHFEVLKDGEPIDPRSQVTMECNNGNILVRGG
ncbi:MAG: M23 family metallopeptidase [Gemmatimonadota bacterium]|nr:MAG: M23 family metallopeptidase [Gemmatimonadota bacterium]